MTTQGGDNEPLTEAPMTMERAVGIIEYGDREADRQLERALSYYATESCLNIHSPEGLGRAIMWMDERFDFGEGKNHRLHPNAGNPTREHAFARVILAGTMGANYILLGRQACDDASQAETEERVFGPQGFYVVEEPEGEEPAVSEYNNPRADAHMRTLAQLVAAGKNMSLQTLNGQSALTRYEPVWMLEKSTRLSMKIVPHKLNTQANYLSDPVLAHPLNPERIRRTAALFLRNIMHYTLLVIESLPEGSSVEEVQDAVIDRIGAAETAARHSRKQQRTLMGVPGEQYEQRRATQGICPHLTTTTNNAWIVAGLGPPPHPRGCPGQDPHKIPEDLQDNFTPSYASTIEMLTRWSNTNIPFTLLSPHPLPHA